MSLTVPVQHFTHSAVIQYDFITMPSDKPFVALLSQYIETLQITMCSSIFSPSNIQYFRKQPIEQPNFCLQTLHSRYSWEGAKKTVWWKLMSYAIKPVRGMLIIVCFWFVCLFSFFPPYSFSPVYLSMANCVVSSEGCSSLRDIALLSIWYAYHLAGSKCSSAQCQDWHGNVSVRVQFTLSSLPFIPLAFVKSSFLVKESQWSLKERQFWIDVWKKKE